MTLHPTRRRRWSPMEDQLLRTIYPRVGLRLASVVLERTPRAVGERRRRLGIPPRRTLYVTVAAYEPPTVTPVANAKDLLHQVPKCGGDN